MKQELRLQQNNEGFSLVELIVTILISSVVMMAVVGLLTTGLNLYKSVSTETQLQIEGQAACGRINELVQEAQYLEFHSGIGGSNKVLVLMTLEDTDPTFDAWWYYIIWNADRKMLLLTKDGITIDANGMLSYIPSDTDIESKVLTIEPKKHLLAQYIETFNFSEIGESGRLYYIDILLAADNKQFSVSQFINERNK